MPSRPKCVALVTPAWPPGIVPNGINTYVSHLVPAFAAQSVDSVILSWKVLSQGLNRSGQASETRNNGETNSLSMGRILDVVDISQFQPQPGLVARAVKKIRRSLGDSPLSGPKYTMIQQSVETALDRFPIDLVEMEEAFGLAARVAAIGRVPVVTRLHGPWFLNGEVLGLKKDAEFTRRVAGERESIVRANAVSAPSQDVLDRTRAFYDLPLPNARVILSPVDLSECNPAWDLSECDRNRIVFIGRIDMPKGADVIVDAFVRLASSHPKLELDLIGPDRGIPDSSGRPVHGSEFLDRRIPDGVIRRRIHLRGQKTADELRVFRRRGFLTVVPSRYETFGYTAIEALGLGCPLVVADTGGLKEIVRHGESGLLFRSEDSSALAAQIERLLADPPFAARLGETGREQVHRRYDPNAIAQETLDFYALTIERWKAGAMARAQEPRSSG